jgi:hypothetical protein
MSAQEGPPRAPPWRTSAQGGITAGAAVEDEGVEGVTAGAAADGGSTGAAAGTNGVEGGELSAPWPEEGGCEAALAALEVGCAEPKPGGGARDVGEWSPVALVVPVGGRKSCTRSSSVRKFVPDQGPGMVGSFGD